MATTRRGFLKGLGLAVAATVVAPKAVGAMLAKPPAVAPVAALADGPFKARVFIPYSVELMQDYPNFEADMQALLSDHYEHEVVASFMREPYSSSLS